MRIISQDKTMSLNFNEITVRVEGTYITADIKERTRTLLLGSYKTKERAIKVFTDIHNYFYRHISVTDIDNAIQDTYNNFDLFYMPEELG